VVFGVSLVSDGQYLYNNYTLFMTFGHLWTLYVRVCGINDLGHTRDEYLVLFTKPCMTEAQLAELHHHRFVLGIERAVMINREELPHPTFASASQNVAAAVALLDTLPAPSTDGVDKVYQ
jgi:hypothetical protein